MTDYEKIDLLLRNNLDNDDAEEYSEALDLAIKAAKREALLKAIEILVADEAYNVEKGYGSNYLPAINALKQMAKEKELE
jgi:hypothetical protein